MKQELFLPQNLPQDRRLGKAKANPQALLLLCDRLALLCFAKIGGGSAKQKQILRLFFCSALALHYLCTQLPSLHFPKMRSWISLCAIKRPILRFICITKESPEPLSPSAEGHTKQLRHDATYLLASLLRHCLRHQFSAHRWLHAPAPQDL